MFLLLLVTWQRVTARKRSGGIDGGAVAVQLGEAEVWELQDGMLQEAAVGWGCLRGNLIRVSVSGTVADRVKQCRGTAVQAHLRLRVLP